MTNSFIFKKIEVLKMIEKECLTKYPTVDATRQDNNEITESIDEISALPYPEWQKLIKYMNLLRTQLYSISSQPCIQVFLGVSACDSFSSLKLLYQNAISYATSHPKLFHTDIGLTSPCANKL